VGFEAKTKHLSEISRLPQEHWAALVERMLAEEWSVGGADPRRPIGLVASADILDHKTH
jgi:hypothetical protein